MPPNQHDQTIPEGNSEAEGGCSLEDLIARISADNLHELIDFGKPKGNEAW
jgi:antitoxin component of MazEF toxin-antitoxin module